MILGSLNIAVALLSVDNRLLGTGPEPVDELIIASSIRSVKPAILEDDLRTGGPEDCVDGALGRPN
jgi:hypothetical protein